MILKYKIILFLLLANLLFCSYVFGRTSGISTTFLKKRELMAGDSWSSKPLNVAAAAQNLEKYDAIWCSQLIAEHNRPSWKWLRENRADKLMFHTVSGNSTRPRVDNSYVYNYINNNHPEWFLLQDTEDPKKADAKNPDNRIRWNPTDKDHTYYNRFFFDVGNEQLQRWIAKYLSERLAMGVGDNTEFAYDGIAMDNVLLGVWHKSISRRCPNWTYAGKKREWNKAYFDYLKVVKKKLNEKGFILVVNQTLDYSSNKDGKDWDRLAEGVNGMTDEKALGYSEHYLADDKWLASIERHEWILDKGLVDWWVCYPRKDGEKAYEEFLYTYCSWLLVKRPEKSFYYATRGVRGYGNPVVPWYKEYDLPIGESTTKRYKIGDCWARNYQNAAIIVVNPTRQAQQINFCNNGEIFVDHATNKMFSGPISLPPQSGRIFLRTTDEGS